MGRKKQSYRVGGPSKDQLRHRAPYWCKWYELVTDKSGSREVAKSQWFPTLAEADSHGKRVTGNRADVRDFTDQERLQAIHFFRECEARGLSAFDVFTAGLRHFNAETVNDIDLKQAIELYCIYMTGEKYSPKTISGRESALTRLMRECGEERIMASFTPQELVTIIKKRYDNHISQVTLLRDMKSFFAWAARNGYCRPETARDAVLDPNSTKSSVRKSALRRTHKRPPRLRADQIKPMFAAVDERYHPALALAVFAGLRPESELPRIEWQMIQGGHAYGIDFESRTISLHESWVTKTFMERTLHDLPDPLWRILERHKKTEGRISPVNYRNWRLCVIEPIKKALSMEVLPNDIFRHTALSFQYTLIGQAGTMNNAGHTNPRTFQQHYNNAVGRKEAEEFQGLEL